MHKLNNMEKQKNIDETRDTMQQELSPMLKQWTKLKEKHPDALLLFRVGDFYETYKEDARAASKILGITLARNEKMKGQDGKPVEMAGFPHHALDYYLPKLIRAGQSVAICDQLEDPQKLKKHEKRGMIETESQDNKNTETVNNNNEPKQEREATMTKKEKKTEKKEEQVQAAQVEQQATTQQTTATKKQEGKKDKSAKAEKEQKPKQKLANGDTLDYVTVFRMSNLMPNANVYGVKCRINGVEQDTKKLTKEERAMWFDKKIDQKGLVEMKYPVAMRKPAQTQEHNRSKSMKM